MEKEIFAIGVVVLPSNQVSSLAISLSQRLKNSPFVLNLKDYLPHITLVQSYINDLEKLRKR